MPFVALALYTIFCRKENDKKIPKFTFPIDSDYKNSLVLFTYLYLSEFYVKCHEYCWYGKSPIQSMNMSQEAFSWDRRTAKTAKIEVAGYDRCVIVMDNLPSQRT